MVPDARRRPRDGDAASGLVQLSLLGGFRLRSESVNVNLVQGAQRLAAFLGLQGKWLRRGYVAGTLLGDSPEDRATGSLRSALWRLRVAAGRVVETSHDELRLAPSVEVDAQHASEVACRVLGGDFGAAGTGIGELYLWQELLPGWYDDWVLLERERHRQLALLSLEALAKHYTEIGRRDAAVLAALAAVEREPLRESAHRALVRAHLDDGNVAEAMRRFHIYEGLLRAELGIAPSPKMKELVAGLLVR